MSTDAKKKPGGDDVIPMPDIYADEFAVDDSFIEDAKPKPARGDTDSGFNPYDTVTLYKK